MPVMTPEQRQKRVDQAQREVDKLTVRRDRLQMQLAQAELAFAEARRELDWWKRPVEPEPERGESAP